MCAAFCVTAKVDKNNDITKKKRSLPCVRLLYLYMLMRRRLLLTDVDVHRGARSPQLSPLQGGVARPLEGWLNAKPCRARGRRDMKASVNLQFPSFAPRHRLSKLISALGLASVALTEASASQKRLACKLFQCSRDGGPEGSAVKLAERNGGGV